MKRQSALIEIMPLLSIDELKYVIKNSCLLIGNDTGPTHMAWGLNTPSITLFGPTPVHRVYETPINRTLNSSSKVDQFNLDRNDFTIKEIKVNQKSKLSLQKHKSRSEFWQIVKGESKITIKNQEHFLKEKEHIYIPKNTIHRIENIGKDKLIFIEIQLGENLKEEDIIRIEDDYGRV